MRVACIAFILLATFSSLTIAMAAGMQLAGLRGAQFPFPFLLGPSWTWFWIDVLVFVLQVGGIVFVTWQLSEQTA